MKTEEEAAAGGATAASRWAAAAAAAAAVVAMAACFQWEEEGPRNVAAGVPGGGSVYSRIHCPRCRKSPSC